MKISFQWIKKYLKETDITPEDLVKKIKLHLADVESVEDLKEKFQYFLIGEIVKKENHPNADKLGVYQVKIGEKEIIQVVAGDKNLKVGDKTVYLPPKTKIPFNGEVIQETKLRGVTSKGMLASEKELGISSNHDNVMKVDIDCKAGENVSKVLELDDYIIEIEKKTLTIRPDTFGIIGIARDISGFLKLPFKTPQWLKDFTQYKPNKLAKEILPLTVKNQLTRLCPRYMAIAMTNVKVDQSPLWLKVFLSSIGIKPINNVVDITNYLMVLTGQPLHAFDYDKVISKDLQYKNQAVITIRTAKLGEKLTTIDEKTRELTEKTVVICDSQNPIAIGGVMGGFETEIDQNSKNIIIESANFNLYNIRKTSMALGIVTDAVTRFSKGQDPNLCQPVLYQAIELVKELCNAEIASNVQDAHMVLPEPHRLTFSVDYFQKHIGLKLSRDEMVKILSNIEIEELKTNDKDLITLQIPTYRQDLKIPEDIHEEIVRLHGYKEIQLNLPKRDIKPVPSNPSLDLDKEIRNILKGIGANELLTYNFVSEKLYKNCNLDIKHNYRLTNALSSDLEYMRSTLIPSLLEKVSLNINNGYEEFALFEINKVHNKLDFDKKENLPIEQKVLSFVYTKNTPNPYYHAKYYLNNLLKELKIKDIQFETISELNKNDLPNQMKIILPIFDVHKTAIISTVIDNKKIYLGVVGEPNLEVQGNFKLIQSTAICELNLDNLQNIVHSNKKHINFSKYPKITQDLCFVLNQDIPYSILEYTITKLLEKRGLNFILKPIDIYQQNQQGNVKQITIRIILQHQGKTLKEKDVNSIREIIEKNVKNKLGGVLKS